MLAIKRKPPQISMECRAGEHKYCGNNGGNCDCECHVEEVNQ